MWARVGPHSKASGQPPGPSLRQRGRGAASLAYGGLTRSVRSTLFGRLTSGCQAATGSARGAGVVGEGEVERHHLADRPGPGRVGESGEVSMCPGGGDGGVLKARGEVGDEREPGDVPVVHVPQPDPVDGDPGLGGLRPRRARRSSWRWHGCRAGHPPCGAETRIATGVSAFVAGSGGSRCRGRSRSRPRKAGAGPPLVERERSSTPSTTVRVCRAQGW